MSEASSCWGDYCGAVSLSFDDGRATQLEHAIPMMDERGIRGTFYISSPIAGENWEDAIEPWQGVARTGHEIGNHSLSHTCSANFAFCKDGGLEAMTLEAIEADILAAQQRLKVVAPDQQHWTFAYPCYQTFVGRGEGRKSYVPVVAKHFLCGRGRAEFGTASIPAVCDLAAVGAIGAERMSGFEMIGLVEELTSRGQWVNLCFHEIDGPNLSVARSDFAMLLDYLKRTESEIMAAPLVEVARKVSAFQAGL